MVHPQHCDPNQPSYRFIESRNSEYCYYCGVNSLYGFVTKHLLKCFTWVLKIKKLLNRRQTISIIDRKYSKNNNWIP